MTNEKWVVIVFDTEEVVDYAKGPFETREAAEDWARDHESLYQITLLDSDT